MYKYYVIKIDDQTPVYTVIRKDDLTPLSLHLQKTFPDSNIHYMEVTEFERIMEKWEVLENPYHVRHVYAIFAGLGGGFGGARLVGLYECGSEADASTLAYEEAVQIYEDHVGLHGLRTIEQIMEDSDLEQDEAEAEYFEEMESWLSYYEVQLS